MEKIIHINKSPLFKKKIYTGRPNIVDKSSLFHKFRQILKSKWLTNDGPFTREFEEKIADYTGVKHCVVVANATIGLEILERALDLSGEVILPSMTFIASPNSLLWQGIKPIFCDIDPKTWNIDPSKIEKLITPKTSAIMGVHVFGRPCNTSALQKIAKSHHLHLFYDAAHAFGCSHQNKMIGNFGEAEVFSFHATKFFNSIEGGAIVTNNTLLANKLKMIRNFGFSGHDETSCLGINGKMNEFSAAFGLTSFEQIDKILSINLNNYLAYKKFLTNIPGIELIDLNLLQKNNYQYVMIKVDEQVSTISRDQLVQILWSENIIVRRYFYPGCHRLEPYSSISPKTDIDLPVTNLLTNQLICLPTGQEITESKILKISNLIRYCVQHGPKISSLFKSSEIKDLTGVKNIIIPEIK